MLYLWLLWRGQIFLSPYCKINLMKIQCIIHQSPLVHIVVSSLDQSMTEAVFLTLGRSQSFHSKKLGLRPKA